MEDYDSELKNLKAKAKEVSWEYFAYQKDKNLAMHMAVENVVHLFQVAPREIQAKVLPYISRIMALELKNEQSKIAAQSTMVNELLAWVSYTNIERSVPVDAENLGEGSLWVLNDEFIHIAVVDDSVKVTIRNAVSNSGIDLKLHTILRSKNKDVRQNYAELKQLKETKVATNIEQSLLLTPKHFMSLLPGVLQSRFNEELGVWKPIKGTPEIIKLVKGLDEVPVYNIHGIGIFYLPKHCIRSHHFVRRYNWRRHLSVSYTHLTLPTIYSV
eukprot:TRINITY_DN771_c0_g1_i9.p1 TRINITY_DN771_c0_g1~~TRINITY_DN771_c0_g1_i9.p1  ORF type:complete len:271 (+),score=56.88 TRINITY_DN771_c0_g1_i9:3-815(+)